MPTKTQYESVPAAAARAIKADKNQPTVMDVLRSGEMVFLPGKGAKSVAGWRTAFRAEGKVIRTRLGDKDGKSGVFVWAEDKPE